MNKEKLLQSLEDDANEWAGDMAVAQDRGDDVNLMWYAGATEVTNVLIARIETGIFDD